jgi:hypothetical protein
VILANTEGGAAQDVVFQFLHAVSTGDREKAMSHVVQKQSHIEMLSPIVDSWAVNRGRGEHRFIIGEATYGGLLSSGQYAHLDEDDPQVRNARVEVCIDGGPVQGFSLELVGGQWKVWGVMVPMARRGGG